MLFLAVWRRVIRILAKTTKIIVNDRGHSPLWLGKLIVMVYYLMWLWHDQVHVRIWNAGHGEVIIYDGRTAW